MAEEKKKADTTQKIVKFILASVFSVGGCYFLSTLDKNVIETKELFSTETYTKEGNPVVGRKIQIKEGSPVYGTVTDAINETNRRTPYYSADEERYVMSAFYQYNNEFIRIDMNDYTINENEILTKNGKLVAVLTTVNPETKEQEAYYSAEDIKVSTKIINLVKN